MNDEDLCCAIDIITLFVRSVRMPRSLSSVPGGSSSIQEGSCTTTKDLQAFYERHPVVNLVSSCGTLFIDVIRRRSVGHSAPTSASDSVVHLMTSLVTYITPTIPPAKLAEFTTYLWTMHVKELRNISFAPYVEFISEFMAVLGQSSEDSLLLASSRSDSLDIGIYGKRDFDLSVADQTAEEVAASNFILEMIKEQLNTLFSETCMTMGGGNTAGGLHGVSIARYVISNT